MRIKQVTVRLALAGAIAIVAPVVVAPYASAASPARIGVGVVSAQDVAVGPRADACDFSAVVSIPDPTAPRVLDSESVQQTQPGCCEATLDDNGNVVLPPGATDVQYDNVDTDTGRTTDLYPAANAGLDTWYAGQQDASDGCPWSIGGTVPPMDRYEDIDTLARDAGFTSPGADLVAAMDDEATALPSQVQRPAPDQMASLGEIPDACWDDPTAEVGTGQSGQCSAGRRLNPRLPFSGRDVIYVHGFDPQALADELSGVPGAQTRWPGDRAEFESGYWKGRADELWNDQITRELKRGVSTNVPTNRYLTVAWPSTQWLAYGVHAFLSQVAAAMANGTGVVEDATGSDRGFCETGCVVVSDSTGGPLVDAALAIASLTETPPFAALGDLTWLPPRIFTHVAFSPAFQGSHYATLAAALGWAVAFLGPLCELVDWVMTNVFDITLPCGHSSDIARSALTDLAVPVMQAVWQPLVAATPVPTLVAAGAHPTSIGYDSALKYASPFVKMLFHPGLDDGIVSLDSQCATLSNWRDAPQTFVARPTFYDAPANYSLVSAGLPPVFVARAYDMGISTARGLYYYVDQVVGADLGTPAFWTALGTGTLPAHFAASLYHVAAACVPYVSPTGMVEPVARATTPVRMPNHYSFLLAAADHLTPGIGPYATGCYESTFGGGQDCSSNANDEEVRAIDDPAVYARGLVKPAIGGQVVEHVKGRRVSFRIGFIRVRFWIWRRVYHRLAGWESSTEPDYAYRYVG